MDNDEVNLVLDAENARDYIREFASNRMLPLQARVALTALGNLVSALAKRIVKLEKERAR